MNIYAIDERKVLINSAQTKAVLIKDKDYNLVIDYLKADKATESAASLWMLTRDTENANLLADNAFEILQDIQEELFDKMEQRGYFKSGKHDWRDTWTIIEYAFFEGSDDVLREIEETA